MKSHCPSEHGLACCLVCPLLLCMSAGSCQPMRVPSWPWALRGLGALGGTCRYPVTAHRQGSSPLPHPQP